MAEPMKYRLLGSGALRVSELCLGTMTFGSDHPMAAITMDTGRDIVARFRGAGGNFIDTANMYTGGQSERMIGEIIAPFRAEIVLATKYGNSMNPADPNAGGMHRKNLVQSVEQSLRRLGTDYIDLYYIHTWDRFTAMDEALRALDDLVRAGKILHIGASNIPAWQVSAANTRASLCQQTPFSAVQVQYNLANRTIEHETIPMARALDVAVVAWSPLAMGVLTGKYLDGGGRDGRLAGSAASGSSLLNDRSQAIARLCVEIAAEIDATPSQVAIAWLLSRNVIPVIGGSSASHFDEALASRLVTLDADVMERLDRETAPEPNQPGALYPRIDTMIHGEVVTRIVPR